MRDDGPPTCAAVWALGLAVGREDQAEVAYHHCAGLDGAGLLADGKARLSAARALILANELDEALDQIQITQLRRSQSRHEAEINRLLPALVPPAKDRYSRVSLAPTTRAQRCTPPDRARARR